MSTAVDRDESREAGAESAIELVAPRPIAVLDETGTIVALDPVWRSTANVGECGSPVDVELRYNDNVRLNGIVQRKVGGGRFPSWVVNGAVNPPDPMHIVNDLERTERATHSHGSSA